MNLLNCISVKSVSILSNYTNEIAGTRKGKPTCMPESTDGGKAEFADGYEYRR